MIIPRLNFIMLKYSVQILSSFVFLSSCTPSFSEEEDHSHDYSAEIGFSLAYVYLEAEKESAPGLHLHFLKHLEGVEFLDRLAIGLGFEGIFAEHKHYSVMGSLAYFPWRGLSVTLSPGILFAKHEEQDSGGDAEWESQYVTHLEASYGFHFGEYEIGPVIGFADSEEDKHYMFGLHFGIGF